MMELMALQMVITLFTGMVMKQAIGGLTDTRPYHVRVVIAQQSI